MPDRLQIQAQIRNIICETCNYINMLYWIPCTYTRNVILNLISDRLKFINFLASQLNDNITLTGTDTAKPLPGNINLAESGIHGITGSGLEQLVQGIVPAGLQNITGIPVQTIEENQAVFTTEQLSKYTGKSGAPAYVAVNGVVYDVTNSAAWAAATHFGLTAGKDLTKEFASCHAGQNILSKLKSVGRLI